MTKSRIFLLFSLVFISGIFIGSFFYVSQIMMLGFLILALFFIFVFFKNPKSAVIGLSILFFVLGIWRFQLVDLAAKNDALIKYNDREQKITILGTIIDEPQIGSNNIKLTIKTEQIIENEKTTPVFSKILINTNRYPEYQYGDKLKIEGFLKNPEKDINGFNYKNYLKKDGIYSIMAYPKIELVGKGFGSTLMKVLFSFKEKFKEITGNFISPSQQGLLEALIFGDESNIPKELKDKFNFTGTRHITAVSGMNITILASIILSFCLSLGMWRSQAFYLSVFLLILYILMIGAPASAIRAGIMAIFFLTAQHVGRLSSTFRSVVFAAALMLFQNPFLLVLDVGFQLSFLAILGMIHFQPIFSNWLLKTLDFKFFPLKTTLIATLSAQIFTLPILIYNFGYFSLVSPFANILIVPLLAPITILIFIFGLSAILFFPLGYISSWLVWLFLTYIIEIINWFSKVSFASITFKNISWIYLMIYYSVLSFLVWQLNKKFLGPKFLK